MKLFIFVVLFVLFAVVLCVKEKEPIGPIPTRDDTDLQREHKQPGKGMTGPVIIPL